MAEVAAEVAAEMVARLLVSDVPQGVMVFCFKRQCGDGSECPATTLAKDFL